jgi:hypothetical protein
MSSRNKASATGSSTFSKCVLQMPRQLDLARHILSHAPLFGLIHLLEASSRSWLPVQCQPPSAHRMARAIRQDLVARQPGVAEAPVLRPSAHNLSSPLHRSEAIYELSHAFGHQRVNIGQRIFPLSAVRQILWLSRL